MMREKLGVSAVAETAEIFIRDLPKELTQEVNSHNGS
jgi:hypothetical protein